MLRYDIALQVLKRQIAAKPKKTKPSAGAKPLGGVLIPFPLRRLTAGPEFRQKRRLPS